MAINPLYENQLKGLLTDPNSFSGTPGFQFALNSGLGSINSSNSAQRGSGNVLAALTKYGTGLAQQDYGNQRDFLGKMTGQEQQYGLGHEQNANQSTDIANRYKLGSEANANTRTANDQQFGLGMYNAGNQYNLGMTNAGNTAQNNYWNYMLGGQQNANTAANNQNNYNLGAGKNQIDWFNSGTAAANGQANAWNMNQANELKWKPYAASAY